MKKLGIIGGMGPAATSELFRRIVEKTDSDCDQNHLEIICINKPDIPDRTEYILNEEGADSFDDDVIDIAETLEKLGCDVLAMPCNTAFYIEDEIIGALHNATLISMPRKTIEYCKALGLNKIALLATLGTYRSEIYKKHASDCDVNLIQPNDETIKHISEIIYSDVKSGHNISDSKINTILDDLSEKDYDGVILGCTELSLLGLSSSYKNLHIVDSLDILAKESILLCGAVYRGTTDYYFS